jgi:glutathione S-transferase
MGLDQALLGLWENEVFRAYALSAVLLTLKMMAASFNVTRLRFTYGAFKYDEDYIGKEGGKKALSERAKEAIAKAEPLIQRAYGLHVNDMENIYVFYTIGFLYALSSPPVFWAKVLFYGYLAARFMHSVAYLLALQPWRALFYMANVSIISVMCIHLLFHLLI